MVDKIKISQIPVNRTHNKWKELFLEIATDEAIVIRDLAQKDAINKRNAAGFAMRNSNSDYKFHTSIIKNASGLYDLYLWREYKKGND